MKEKEQKVEREREVQKKKKEEEGEQEEDILKFTTQGEEAERGRARRVEGKGSHFVALFLFPEPAREGGRRPVAVR